jgi:hypothetical protein
MTGETIIYKGMPKSFTIKEMLELQQWIVDPDSRPYTNTNNDELLVARSAAAAASTPVTKSNIEKQLELQQRILGNL